MIRQNAVLAVGIHFDLQGVFAGIEVFEHIVAVDIRFGLGDKLVSLIHSYDSYVWVPCAALGISGLYMIWESMTTHVPPENDGIGAMSMIGPAIATSCDALLVGLLFVNESAGIVITGLLAIGLVTALISIFGVWVGRRKGTRYNGIVQVLGGILLILLGIEKLLENLDIIKFTL